MTVYISAVLGDGTVLLSHLYNCIIKLINNIILIFIVIPNILW